MNKQDMLNFTHGTMLQSFCQRLLDDSQCSKEDLLNWLSREKEELRRNQFSPWGITDSMQCCYDYLERIEQFVISDASAEEISELLEEIKSVSRTTVHALFLAQELSCWPSMESLFKAAQNDENFVATLVYTPFNHENFSQKVDHYDNYREMEMPIVRHDKYDLQKDSPDVAFIIKPYANIPEKYHTKNLEKVVPRIVYIPYGMEITTDLIKFGFQYYSHYKAWRHCAYGPVVKEYGTKYGYRNGENIVVWGHPKADHYKDMAANRENIPEEWKEKINGRKTILWTPHHLINLDENGTGTWLIWGEKILQLAEEHTELCFILRPHLLMLGALVNSGAMTQAKVDQLRERIDEAENIIWDTNDGYHTAFDAADAIITDGTTFSVEFLYTKKPILLTPRNMEGFYNYQDMLESYYVVKNLQDVEDFMQMIANDEDPLKEKRLAMYERQFYIPEDCTVGENIIRNVKMDLENECKRIMLTDGIADKSDSQELIQTTEVEKPQPQYPLFSILVLCYKNQNLLFGMLDSIFKQDYPRIQLIISDDGSEDFDVKKVQNYIKSRKRANIEQVIVRKNPTNMRTVRHIEMAMSYVSGEYFVFTAADDRFNGTDAISKYEEYFLSNPDKVWLVGRCNITSPDYKKTLYVTPTAVDEPYFRSGSASDLFSRWSRRGMAIPCCMAFRKEAYELLGGFDMEYEFMEDWPFVLKLLRQGYAPIFCEKITAIHSTGGVTNSNQRYGKEIRKLFFDDKYLLFRKEVKPYLSKLKPEDKKAYKQYMKEIMARHYFFYIDWPGTTTSQRFFLCLKKPIRFWWVFEQRFEKVKNKVNRKKLLLASQGLMLLGMLLMRFQGDLLPDFMLQAMGWLYLCIGSIGTLVSLVMTPLEKHFAKKAKLRQSLVN